MSSNNIIQSLGLTPVAMADRTISAAPQSDSPSQEAEDDIQNARNGLYHALNSSREVVEDMVSIAKQSQHPKAYEVLNSAIKTLADISTELGSLQLKKQRLETKNNSKEGEGGTVNNNLFVGSTADLQKLIEEMKNKSV